MKIYRMLNAGASLSALTFGMSFAPCVIAPALAQDANAPSAVETIIITGSKIARKDADSVGPLTTLTTKDIDSTASYSIGDILQKLPDAGVSYTANGSQGTSFGSSSISLRYLANTDGDADRTLVLVDGHRWVDGTGARGIRDFVDLNTIPIGVVGSVEILQDGASAIYGADAIAGVVNIHTRQDVDGLSVSGKVGDSSRNDGQEYSSYVNWGTQLDHGSVFLSVSYVKDDAIGTANRGLTQTSLTEELANLSTPPASPQGLYVLPGFSTSAHPLTQNAGITVATGPNSYHTAALPGDYYNTDAQGLDASGPEERYGIYGRITNDLTSNITLTVDALYNRRISSQLLSPTDVSFGGTSGTEKGFSIAANQMYNPFGVAFAPNQAWSISIFTPQIGDRGQIEDVSNERVSIGLKGSLGLLGREFVWNLFGSYARDDMKFQQTNNVDLEKLDLALGSPASCAAVPGCIPVNIFGQMTAAQAAYILNNAHETNSTALSDLSFDITGNVLTLPAGDLGAAFGVEVRRNTGQDNPDVYANTASTGTGLLPLPSTTPTTTGPTRTPTADGSNNVREAYLELNAPILADLPLAKSLDVDAATRISDYDSVGSHITNKIGIGYRPVEDLLLRGTYSQGFRAPSLIELYTGSRLTATWPAAIPTLAMAEQQPTRLILAALEFHRLTAKVFTIPAFCRKRSRATRSEARDGSNLQCWSFVSAILVRRFYAHLRPIQCHHLQCDQHAVGHDGLAALCRKGGAYCSVVTRDATTGQVLNFVSAYENLNSIKTSGVDTTARYNFDTDFGHWEAVASSSLSGYVSPFLSRIQRAARRSCSKRPEPRLGVQVRPPRARPEPHWKADDIVELDG